MTRMPSHVVILAPLARAVVIGVALILMTTLLLLSGAHPVAAHTASWYGPGFEGRRTANGERFNSGGLTAAHKSLPFGTHLRVTHNGRSVVVRINDRGPFVRGRDLDLSRGAARAIGLDGVGHVTISHP